MHLGSEASTGISEVDIYFLGKYCWLIGFDFVGVARSPSATSARSGAWRLPNDRDAGK
jgi:hypothetical protein